MTRLRRASYLSLLVTMLTLGWPSSASGDVDCDDFSSSGAAQNYYERQMGDPDDLDRDSDGYACDYGPPSGTTESESTPTYESSRDNEDTELWFVFGGIGLVMVWGLMRSHFEIKASE